MSAYNTISNSDHLAIPLSVIHILILSCFNGGGPWEVCRSGSLLIYCMQFCALQPAPSDYYSDSVNESFTLGLPLSQNV